MTHHDIHEIISQISQSIECPECKAKITPNNIKITDIVDNNCVFDVKCDKCRTEMTLTAHVEKTQNEEAMYHNQSSKIIHDNIVTESINLKDVQNIKKVLANFGGSFIDAFY